MSSGVETRPTKAPKFAAVIDESLGQVQRKIRLADLTRGLLALTALTFAYLLIAAGFDLATGGASILVTAIRFGLFGVFAVAFVVLAGWTLLRYLTRVNPYFAARRLEETIPDAKNSLINWLDLRDEKTVPPAIYQAVGLRAAKDAQAADPELVVSTKETTRLGITIGVLAVALGVLFLFAPHQFRGLITRAFVPLSEVPATPPTTIALLKPADGDAVVGANQRVDVLAAIEGPVGDAGSPEAPALHYRNDPTDLFQRVPLEENRDGRWGVRLTPEQIRSGLTYKLTAGPAATPEHRLTVRTQPFVQEFAVTYRFRDYRKAPPETVVFPNPTSRVPQILERRGTEVDLTIHANTAIAKGKIEFESAGKFEFHYPGEPIAADPKAMRFRFTLNKSGTIRIEFEAPGGERNLDREPYEVRVLDDGAPSVTLVEPGKDIAAPVNGTLLLVGKAFDDFGVTGLTLQLRVPGKKDLVSQPYRAGKSFKFVDGSYPLAIEYYDTLRLEPLKLAAGTELEYWLEATDNCDYPKPNVGKSATYKLKLITPDTDLNSQKSKNDQAEMQARAGQKKQDEQGQENKDRNDQKDSSGEGNSGDKGSTPNQEKAQKDKLENDIKKTADKLPQEGGGSNESKEPSKPNESGSNDKRSEEKSNAGDNPKGSGNESSSKDNPKNGDDKKSPSSDGKSDNSKPDPNSDAKSNPKSDTKSGDTKSGDQKSGAGQSPEQKSAKAPKDGKPDDSGDGGGGDSAKKDSKQAKEKDNPSKKSPESGGSKGGDSDDSKEQEKGGKDAKEKAPGGKGSESENGNKVTGSQPEKSSPTDTAAKEGGDGKSGTEKASNKKDAAQKGDGPVGPNASTEAAKKKSDNLKTSKDAGDPKANPDGGTASKGKDGNKDPQPGKAPEPSRGEIETLGKKLKENAPDADKMAKDLVERGLDMKNDDNKKSLESTLNDAGRGDLVDKLHGEEPLPPPMAAGNAPMPDNKGKDPGVAQGASGNKKDEDPHKKGSDAAANTGGGAGYAEEKLKALTPDAEFRRKLGNLQLDNIEDLKKRFPPEVRKTAGVSEAEWQQFLKNAAEYQRYLQRHRPEARPDAKTLTDGKSTIAGQGAQAVQTAPGAERSTVEGSAIAPPPEFEDAQRAFTRGKRN
jgi:collagen type III alpha